MPLLTFDGTPVKKPFSWSFSKLDQFRTCGTKFYHTQIKKDYPEGENEHMRWGNRVHGSMANRILHGTPLPVGMEQWEKWAAWATNNSDGSPPDPGAPKPWCELKMAITEQLQRCEYFDKRVPVWFRTVADVLKVNGPAARLIDWKTGKVKEDSDQLALGALTVMLWYPEVQVVRSEFVYLQHDVIDKEDYVRADMPRILQRVLPDVIALQQALDTGVFSPKPSGLCKRHCPVLSCAYHGRGAY